MAARTAKRGWAYLTRAGGEGDVLDEIGEAFPAVRAAEGVVFAEGRAKGSDGSFVELAFARQAMRPFGTPVEPTADRVAHALAAALAATPKLDSWALQVVAPDSSEPRDPRRKAAEVLDAALGEALEDVLPRAAAEAYVEDAAEASHLAQVWIVDPSAAIVGVTPVGHVLSIVPGGRLHLERAEDAPSRAGLKLEEAIAWIGQGPGRGDLVVDLGAAPGAWTALAVSRGAKVIAVDPGKLKVALPKDRAVYVDGNAFEYVPPETVDWLLCDMAWRPLEVAKLIAKWGRRVWAQQLVANFKLPMKQKVKILREVAHTLTEAGWSGLRARQLYHDRDEVTVYAWLDPKMAARGYQEPFQWRNKPKEAPPRKPKKIRNRQQRKPVG